MPTVRIRWNGARVAVRVASLASLSADVLALWKAAHSPNASNGDCESDDGTFLDIRYALAWRSKYVPREGLFSGSPDFDQWHGDVCGCGSVDVTARPTKVGARRVAREILADVWAQLADCDDCART